MYETHELKMAQQKPGRILRIRRFCETAMPGILTSRFLSLDGITVVSLSHFQSQLYSAEGIS